MSRVAGAAAFTGGGLYVAKAASILATGVQPPYAFEVAPLFFAAALPGLRPQGWRWVPVAVALAAGAAAAVVAVARPEALSEDGTPAAGLVMVLAVLSTLVALVLLGLAWRRRGEAPRWVGTLALLLGAGAIPLLLAGGLLSLLQERLLEIPILALGIGWVALGTGLRERGN